MLLTPKSSKANLSLGLLGEEDGVDVGEDSTGSDGDSAKKLVELLIVLDSKGDVPGGNPGLLVVAGGVSGKFEDLSGEVLEDSSEIDTGSDSDAGSVSSLLEVPSDTGNRELKSSLGATAHGLSGSTSSLSFSFSCARARLVMECCQGWNVPHSPALGSQGFHFGPTVDVKEYKTSPVATATP